MFSTYVGQQMIHNVFILVMTVLMYSSIVSSSGFKKSGRSNVILLIYVITFFLMCGLRPEQSGGFGDTFVYTASYEAIQASNVLDIEESPEWMFELLMFVFSRFTDVTGFYLFLAAVYIGFHVLACYRLTENRKDVLLLACMANFSFHTYAVNGIRNGAACAMIIYALALFITKKGKNDLVIASILAFCAFFIHKTTVLPIASFFVAMYYTKTRNYIVFWFLSIIISLIAGSQVEVFFSSLGFDDRMASYSQNHEYDDMFSHTGFRWDFLLYSFMPILLGYYITFKRKIADEKYSLLLNTYILCNSFWVMVIRSTSSNRFAYLSWFMYSLVLIYPLLKLPVFLKGHTRKSAMIFLVHTLFTIVLWMMGK